mmetsp:Transcript_5396/g.8015  ORF Transcript_5396/g.8015 Transcript_5396/m.8015 type:complete len:159 (-) Transcript_5396:165-641(-)
MTTQEQNLTLISSDNVKFLDVPREVAIMSTLIKEGIDEDEDEIAEKEFPIPKVESDVLRKVIDFCTLYQKEPMKKIETPLIGDTLETIFDSPQYASFCKGWELEDFFSMHAAANYMNIEPLITWVCISLDNLHLKGKTPAELRQIFMLPAEAEDLASA